MPRNPTAPAPPWERLQTASWGRSPSRPRHLYRDDDLALGVAGGGAESLTVPGGASSSAPPAWVGPLHQILFPSTTLSISVMSEAPFVAGPNHVALFNPGDQFKRQLLARERDESAFMTVGLRWLLGSAPGCLQDGEKGLRFTYRLLPFSAKAYLIRSILFRYPSAEAVPDGHLVNQACSSILDELLGAAPPSSGSGTSRPLIDQAKTLLADPRGAEWTIDRIAKRLFVSPFHLARLFKAETSYTLHGYLTQLRLRRALDLLADRRLDVRNVGARVGFMTHSHFTESFRRAFGVTPSFVRTIDAERLRTLLNLKGRDDLAASPNGATSSN